MPPQKRGPYKRYLRDPNAEVPKTSRWLRQKEDRERKEQERGRDENIPMDAQNEEIRLNGVQHTDMVSISSLASDDTEEASDNNSIASSVDMEETGNNSIASSVDMQETGGRHLITSSADEIQVQQCEELNQSNNADSDSSENEESDRDASSSSAFTSDSEVDPQGNETVEADDYEDDGDDSSMADNAEDLHFGDRGNLLHPDIRDWREWNNRRDQPRGRQPTRRPLYDGAQISQGESDILIMSFILRWGLEDKGIEHLLRLLDCHMPTALLGSKYLFLKKFDTGPSMKMRYFCHECSEMLPIEDERGDLECTCGFEGNVKDLKKDENCFVQMPVSEQIRRVFSNVDVVRQMRKECAECDVVSGNVYKRLRARGVIREDDITLQWNTDGVKPFKSSKVTIWPIQACINELPPLVRRDNMMLCGLYYGKKKPDTNVILKPFVDELTTLHDEGMLCNVAGRGERFVRVHTILACVDSVARAPLQGIFQHNGRYGCSFCLRRGRRVQRGRGFARVFEGGHVGLPRTEEQHLRALRRLENYNEAHNRPKTHVEGVKQGSVLLLLPVFNIIRSFSPDYMHAALEGTVVTFWKHWCNSEYEGKLWHLPKAKRTLLNEKLKVIKPPVEVTRPPRSLDDIALWKASEMKSFLLYYSLPCLKDLLPNRYLRHWLLFVYSMTVFLREKIDRDDFLKARRALAKFVDDIQLLYPNCHSLYTFNNHLLLHFFRCVQDFGGLWSSSTFPYEHFNGILTRLITGTQSVPMQICRSFARLRQLSELSSTVFSLDGASQVGKVLHQAMLSKYCSSLSHGYADGLRLFGSPELYDLSIVEKVAVQGLLSRGIETTAKSYRRMILRGVVFHSSVYGSLSVRDNSIAKMNDGVLVSISRILLVKVSNSLEIFCVILCDLLQPFDEEVCRDNEVGVSSRSFVYTCRRSDVIVSLIPQNIRSKCVGVPYGNAMCVIPIVNSTERD